MYINHIFVLYYSFAYYGLTLTLMKLYVSLVYASSFLFSNLLDREKLQEAFKKGRVKSTIINAIIQGPARAEKTFDYSSTLQKD